MSVNIPIRNHVSIEQITNIRNNMDWICKGITIKPHGFWYGYKNEWIDFFVDYTSLLDDITTPIMIGCDKIARSKNNFYMFMKFS
jgi:hypothetical protein